MADAGSPEFLAEDKGPHLKVGILAPTLVSTLVVLVRLLARCLKVNSFSLGLDDALISAAQVRLLFRPRAGHSELGSPQGRGGEGMVSR